MLRRSRLGSSWIGKYKPSLAIPLCCTKPENETKRSSTFRNYRRHARRLNFPIVRNRQADLTHFPLELARLQIGLPLFILGACSVIVYGWVLHISNARNMNDQAPISLAVPVILLFILGLCLSAGFQSLNILIIDIYPGKAATASAANNVTRCLLGAASSAAIGPLGKSVGWGWGYTVLAGVFLVGSAPLFVVGRLGMGWRVRKKERKEEERRKKEEEETDGGDPKRQDR